MSFNTKKRLVNSQRRRQLNRQKRKIISRRQSQFLQDVVFLEDKDA